MMHGADQRTLMRKPLTVREPLMVAVAQPPCAAYDVAANARAHAAAVLSPQAAGARVVLFPELSLTGYELDADPVDPGDERLLPIIVACAGTGAVALAGAPVAGDSGQVFIAVLAIDGRGASVAYRKMWLGEEEAERFAPGPEPRKLTVGGWRLGLAVCKDTGVAQHAADTAALGIDAYLAGTVKGADEAVVQHERARRIAGRYHLWVAVASFAGPTGGGYRQTAGRSGIWAPDGTLVSGTGPETGAVSRARLGADAPGSGSSGAPER
jgi:predicted amidohydrolase